MGLFGKRPKRSARRATRKAEAKALKHKAKLDAKFGAKNQRKAAKAITKAQKTVHSAANKSQAKVNKAQVSALKAQERAAVQGKISVGSVRKYLGIARLLVPVLTPVVYRGATIVRGKLDERKAASMGVGVEQLTEFTGHGAKLSARIAGAESSLKEIKSKHSDAEATKFCDAITARLTDLSTAVRASEQMPAGRRNAAHVGIAAELDGIEADLLARLGVR